MAVDHFADMSDDEVLALIRSTRGGGEANTPEPIATPTTQTATEPPKFTVKIGGKDVTGTQEDIQKAQNTFETQVTRPQAPPPQERKVTADEYDLEEVRRELASKLEKNPIDAWKYMNKQVFGVDDPGEVMRAQAKVAAELQLQLSALNFSVHTKDWEPTDENVQALDNVIRTHGIHPTNLPTAWNIVKAERAAQVAANPQVVEMPKPVRAPAPPRVTRAGSIPAQEMDESDHSAAFADMSAAEMLELSQKLQARDRRRR